MNNRKINTRFVWGGFLALTILLTLNLYVKFEEEKKIFRQEVQILFGQVVQKDTDRRSREEGANFRFSYDPASTHDKDSIILRSVDTIRCLKNNKDVAQKMSDKEKIDFCIQLLLAFENPIQPVVIDTLFRTQLSQQGITSNTAVIYTFENTPVYSCNDSTFYQSAEALDEITFGSAKTIILQGFVEIPFCYILKKTVKASGVFVLVWILALLLALWLTLTNTGRKIHIIPAPEAPKIMIEIMPGLLLDETHGVLQSGDRRVELINFRLKLFLLLLEHKGYYIETDKLLETIWPDGSVSKDALSSTVKRLKEDLALFPEIQIESGRGRGYMLSLVDIPETTPDPVP